MESGLPGEPAGQEVGRLAGSGAGQLGRGPAAMIHGECLVWALWTHAAWAGSGGLGVSQVTCGGDTSLLVAPTAAQGAPGRSLSLSAVAMASQAPPLVTGFSSHMGLPPSAQPVAGSQIPGLRLASQPLSSHLQPALTLLCPLKLAVATDSVPTGLGNPPCLTTRDPGQVPPPLLPGRQSQHCPMRCPMRSSSCISASPGTPSTASAGRWAPQ